MLNIVEGMLLEDCMVPENCISSCQLPEQVLACKHATAQCCWQQHYSTAVPVQHLPAAVRSARSPSNVSDELTCKGAM